MISDKSMRVYLSRQETLASKELGLLGCEAYFTEKLFHIFYLRIIFFSFRNYTSKLLYEIKEVDEIKVAFLICNFNEHVCEVLFYSTHEKVN